MKRHRDRKVQCPCIHCTRMGGRLLKVSIADAHMLRQREEELLIQENSLENFVDVEIQQPLLPLEMDNEEEDGGIPEEYAEEVTERSLEQAILSQIINVQSVCDSHGASIGLQDFLLKQFLGGFDTKEVAGEEVNFDNQPLGFLLSELPVGWDGKLQGHKVPDSWKKLMEMYIDLGMVTPERWRLCVGTLDFAHEGVLFPPSLEDCYKSGHVQQCLIHKINKRDCALCCERCRECTLPKKEIKPFDYLPIGPQLTLIMKSKSFCHQILEMWRNRQRWMGKKFK